MAQVQQEIVCPIVHRNGTSAKELVEQLQAVSLSLLDVLNALYAAAPNGRDYYPVPGLLEKATAQHRRRCKVIEDLRVEILQQAEVVSEGL